MHFFNELKSSFISIVFLAYIFFISGIIINFLQLCSCIIWPFNRPLFRKINSYLALGLWSQLTFVAQYWSKTDCTLYISPENLHRISHENIIVIMNHKYDIDWLVSWVACQRMGMLKGSKIVAKQPLKLVPILGWCWVCTETIFVRRVWENDRRTLVNDLQRTLSDYPENHYFNLMLSCEGTRFTEKKRALSMKIAREKGLPELKHHILPRTKGFTLLLQGAENRIESLYDITVGFRKTAAEPTLLNIIKGYSCQAELYIRRFPISDIPNDIEGSSQWIHKLYQEKDEIFDYFAKYGTFEGYGLPKAKVPRNYHDLWIQLAWMIFIGIPSIVYFFQLFWTGSLMAKLIFIIVLFIGTVCVRTMIAVTETDRGSHYGESNKSN